MNRDDIESLIKTVGMPTIVKKVDWEISHDYDGEEVIKIGFHIPESDDATAKQIAEIISAQKEIDFLFSTIPNSLLTYFNIFADIRQKTATNKKKIAANGERSSRSS